MIQIAIYDEDTQLRDVTAHLDGGSIGSGAHGFESADLPALFDSAETERWISDPAAYRVLAVDQWGGVVWQGRIEEVSAESRGIRWQADGDWASLNHEMVTVGYAAGLSGGFIAANQLAQAHNLNPTHVSLSNALIDGAAPGIAVLMDVEDGRCGSVIEKATPPDYGAAVWDGGVLAFRSVADTARTWCVDVGNRQALSHKLSEVVNTAYGRYTDSGNVPQETARVTDVVSVVQHRFARVGAANGDDLATAEAQRDALVAGKKSANPGVTIRPNAIYTMDGVRADASLLRAGDILIPNNLLVDWLSESLLAIYAVKVPLDGGPPSIDVALPPSTLATQVVRALSV